MFQTILVPLDESALAQRAIPFAQTLAQASRSSLVLLRAVAPRTPILGDQIEAEVKALKQVQAELVKIARRIPSEIAVTIATAVGHPADVILAEVRARGADLVVMATHGRSDVGRLVCGSVAEAIVREAKIPVLLIPEASHLGWRPNTALKILIPLDGSDLGMAALDPALRLAKLVDGTATLLTAVPLQPFARFDPWLAAADDPTAPRELTQAYLSRVASSERAGGRVVETRVRAGLPAQVISEVAREEGIDLIVMSTHGHGGLSGVVTGSVAQTVVHQAQVPVLLVRPIMSDPQVTRLSDLHRSAVAAESA